MEFKYDFSKTGLPQDPRFQVAAEMCFDWLNKYMPMFKGEGVQNFMRDQPVAAAKLLIANVPNVSDELIIMTLLGPARQTLLSSQQGFQLAMHLFGKRGLDMLVATVHETHIQDKEMAADLNRLFLVEGLSSMNDQIIDRKRKDAHHGVRWDILKGLEDRFTQIKGENPKLDVIFEEALKRSRQSLELLDRQPANPKKPPGFHH